jgi:hypothetical protein
MGAMVTKVGTGSSWDHVAMVVKASDDDDDDDGYLGVRCALTPPHASR